MVELDKLYRLALENATLIQNYRKRFIYEDIKVALQKNQTGKKSAILVSGIRGVGKTTLMLQLFSELKNAFYLSADSVLVKTSKIYDIVEQIYRDGNRLIFIDEIHKYPHWTDELKNIYDDFDVQIIASGSSTAAIKKGSILLGRRALEIPLNALTLGEFFYLKEGERYTALLDEALNKKLAIRWLAEHPNVEKYYKEYLSIGGFPIQTDEKGVVFKLIKKMIYEDALAEFSLTEKKVDVADKLLGFLSMARLGEFSYNSFASASGYAKSTVYETVHMLKELGILQFIETGSPKHKAKEIIKLLFSHPNLRVAFAEQLMKEADIGSLREEYFVFHIANLGFPIFMPKEMRKNPDYEVIINDKKMLFEIGGAYKTKAQLLGREGTVLDDIGLIVLGFVQKINQK